MRPVCWPSRMASAKAKYSSSSTKSSRSSPRCSCSVSASASLNASLNASLSASPSGTVCATLFSLQAPSYSVPGERRAPDAVRGLDNSLERYEVPQLLVLLGTHHLQESLDLRPGFLAALAL